MGIAEKIASAKKTRWLADGMSEAEVKTTIELAKISAKIEHCRLDLEMTQTEFADYMGVTQGMVSKWESREYNFTIKSLNDICQKLNISFSLSMDSRYIKNEYSIIKWDEEKISKRRNKNAWISQYKGKEAIA